MDGYLLDTSFLTALLDPNHPKHAEARRAEAALDAGAVQYVSIVALAELIFGWRTAVKFGHGPLDAFEEKINKAKAYPLLEPTKHTAEEYGELKAILAKTYLKSALRKDRPRWIEEWVDSATGQKLQVDENDLTRWPLPRHHRLRLCPGWAAAGLGLYGRHPAAKRIVQVSGEAWRWLGWLAHDPVSGRLERYPAEARGPLPEYVDQRAAGP